MKEKEKEWTGRVVYGARLFMLDMYCKNAILSRNDDSSARTVR